MLTKLEIKRQVAHLIYGFIIVSLLFFNVANKFNMVIWLILLAGIVITVASGFNIPLFSWFLDRLERDTEKSGFRAKGLVFYTLGATLAVWLFPKNIAMAAIVILAVGDSLCRLAGSRGYLKHPWNSEKFIEGAVVGGIFATLAATPFVGILPAFCAAAIAMFVESLDLRINNLRIDDNLTIPLVAGTVMYLMHV